MSGMSYTCLCFLATTDYSQMAGIRLYCLVTGPLLFMKVVRPAVECLIDMTL